jgi:sulfite reductase (NADPH) flavoprotein alpha-component
MTLKFNIRRFTAVSHLWLGLTTGAFICLMGVSGAIVAVRPQITIFLAPSAPRVATCQSAIDWNRAAQQVTKAANASPNRIYTLADARYLVRTDADAPSAKYFVYDTCSGSVLGALNLSWLDWTIDLHHNLLFGKTGRSWTGAIAIVLLFGSFSGFLIWLLGNPNPSTALRVQFKFSRRTPRELHRSLGLLAIVILTSQAFTGLWMAFPHTMRTVVATVAGEPDEPRVKRKKHDDSGDAQTATLQQWIDVAHATLPDARIREIRFPEDKNTVQIRMWRPGDFREMGNNVVHISAATAKVLTVDRYADRAASDRYIQAMTGLHYDEWGRIPVRIISAIAGLLTPVLYITGIFMWWYSRSRGKQTRPIEKLQVEEVCQMR